MITSPIQRLGLAIFLLIIPIAASLHAGVTASQWIVVVNGNSIHSRTIANHYCQLRKIPDRNVIVLHEVPGLETTTLEEFKSKILEPVFAQIQERGLAGHIHGIAYSSDFPTAIDFSRDVSNFKDRPHYLTPTGSINGLTYLFKLTTSPSPQLVLGLQSNYYAGKECKLAFELALGDPVRKSIDELEELLDNERWEEATTLTTKLHRDSPQNYFLLYRLAQLWAKKERAKEALELLSLAIERGWCYREEMKNDESFDSLREDPEFFILREACRDEAYDFQPARGFVSNQLWAAAGIPTSRADEGLAYVLSAVLAVTRGEGNTLDEAVRQLTISSGADYTHPKGTFYFTKTADVRSTTRSPSFPLAIQKLEAMGHKAEIVPHAMPMRKDDCLGVTMGISNFDWKDSHSTLLPGAIAENLTSLGGAMKTGSHQTKLSEYLRYGAAGSSGAVFEPYSIQPKFPHPMIHPFYASGLTLAEAFYLSLAGPYQLLIVGDPLCAPFMDHSPVELVGLENEAVFGQTSHPIQFRVHSTNPDSVYVPHRIDVLIDDRLYRSIPFLTQVNLKLEGQSLTGYHRLTFIVSDDSPVQQRWEIQRTVAFGEVALAPVLQSVTEEIDGQSIVKVRVESALGHSIELFHHWESLEKTDENSLEFRLDSKKLGRGPIRLHAVASQGELKIQSLPITIDLP